MEILFEHKQTISPQISIILVDWSCRESFHILHYLSNQTVSREQYEVIWIEYYSRRSPEIEAELEQCERSNRIPIVNKRIVMGMPDDIHYHKHLMYNIGIVASRGKIITICDSDAIVRLTFVENIIKAFKEDRNIVLHMDEVRNVDKMFYPFNYPSIEKIIGEGCINWKDGKTTGLPDKEDPLHARNYGACMSALREDLINIGGADEYIDYLGHICGPYELTFRLTNAGKKEVWHQEEFLYHVWHPGSDGFNNYFGAHDGKNMSGIALDIIRSGRIMPLLENRAIEELRLRGNGISYASLLSKVISELEIEKWKVDRQKHSSDSKPEFSSEHFWIKLLLYGSLFWMSLKQLCFKAKNYSENKVMAKSIFFKFQLVFIFIWRMWKNNIYAVSVCQQVIMRLASECTKEVVFYGTGDITKILYLLAKETPLKITNIYDHSMAGKKFLNFEVLSPETLTDYQGKIIISSFVGTIEKVKALKKIGIDEKNIIRLQ